MKHLHAPAALAASRFLLAAAALLCVVCAGCRATARRTDRDVARTIAQRQRQALNYNHPVALVDADDPRLEIEPLSYDRSPNARDMDVPEGFESRSEPDAAPTTDLSDITDAAANEQTEFRDELFTLTDSLAYAEKHRRELQSAREDLYLSALALTLEHHLWTPQFSAEMRGVYGNYGEIRDFDQAMRFVANLSAAQRLPYGGEFTAAMIGALVRDIGRGITASESSQIQLGLDVPLLRGAGHVAEENLIQLERSLIYAVRAFERFRRRQLVQVARQYFSLLASKQEAFDAAKSVVSARSDLERARDMQRTGSMTVLDVGRAETRLLGQQNSLARSREAFRAEADQFKITLGMPLDEPLGPDDLESIDSIERQIAEGRHPLLRPPPAVNDPERAAQVAVLNRLDLLTVEDRIDDAKRGVSIAQNALLPDLDWTSSLTYDTDPEHYKLGAFEDARATWRSELVLSMNDRFRERNNYRGAMIDVHRARRDYADQLVRIRAEILSAINQIKLQEQLVRIQQRVVDVADERRQYARKMVDQGRLDNRDLVEAEDAHVAALNSLNQAKTAQWSAALNFSLATGTLRVDEYGRQIDDPPTPDGAAKSD